MTERLRISRAWQTFCCAYPRCGRTLVGQNNVQQDGGHVAAVSQGQERAVAQARAAECKRSEPALLRSEPLRLR